MSTYLVVLDRPASAQSLRYGLLDLVSQHKPVELVLLQTPLRRPGDSEEVARLATQDAVCTTRSQLATMGLPVVEALVGDPLPKKAIATAMAAGDRAYDAIVLASKVPALRRLLQIDTASQLERRFGVPVFYVEPDKAADVAA